MASYKQQCMHCGSLIERDSRFCPTCSNNSPFGESCPACLRAVKREDKTCSGCGRSLYTTCPHCKENTFVGSKCDACGESLMVICKGDHCGVMQFFENTKCNVCGKPMTKKKKKK